MNVTGDLASFSVSALLLMLSHEARTGMLVVRNVKEQENTLYLKEGMPHAAEAAAPSRGLLTILQDKGLLNQADVDAITGSGISEEKLPQYLVRKGMVTRKTINSALATKMEDIYYQSLEWREGSFTFAAMPDLPEGVGSLNEVGKKFIVEGIKDPKRLVRIMRALKDLDVYPALSQGLNVVRVKRGLTLNELFLLCLLSPKRSLRTILGLRDSGLLDLCESLVMLQSEGYVTFAASRSAVDADLSLERNAVLTGMVLSLMDSMQRDHETRRDIAKSLELIMPGLGAEVELPISAWSPAASVVQLTEHDLGPEAASIIAGVEPSPAEPALLESPPEPDEPAIEPEIALQPVPGSGDDVFPWYEVEQPGLEPELSPTQESTEVDSLADDLLAQQFSALHQASIDDDLGEQEPLSAEVSEEPETQAANAEVVKSEPQDGELFEEFMEDVVAKRVRYNRFKSDIKMAYNRITMRKLNHFEILEVQPSAPMRDIKKAYQKILARYNQRHLLKERDTEFFEKADFVLAKVEEAFKVLSNPQQRGVYSKDIREKRKVASEKKGLALKMFHEGMGYYKDNLFDKARDAFRKALSYDSNNPVYYNMLETLETQERQKESVKFFQAGKLTHERKGDIKRAIMLIRKAISIEPRSLYYLKLGEILSSDRTMTDDAIMAYDEALKMDPGNAELHTKIGLLKIQKKTTAMKEEALGHFLEALKWDDRNELAKKHRAELEAEGIKFKPKKESTSAS